MMQASNMRGSSAALRTPKPFSATPVSRGSLQVTAALSRARKTEVVEHLKEKLDSSSIVFGMRFKGLDVATMQEFRRGMPEGSDVFICKNNLMKVAVEQTEGWTALSEKGCTGENAWVFAGEDCIADTVKYFNKFADDKFKEAKKNAPKGQEATAPTEVSVAVMSGDVLSPADLKRCESLPTKKELYATIAGLAKQPATKLATGVKAVPNKLAIAIKKLSELDEDTSKTVAECMPSA